MNQAFTRGARAQALRLWIVALALMAAREVQAFDVEMDNPDYKLRWDNTIKYSGAVRLKDRSPALSSTTFGPTGVVGPNNVNQDDGDNNFKKGKLVSNRVDLLSELDFSGPRFGARVSAAAWYDFVYNRSTDNTTTTSNHVPASEFPSETRKIMGRKVEVLDAFVYGNSEVGGKPVSVRLGRHTLLWGESLFFGSNGIAGGQAPLDLVKLLSVPNSQVKEVARPTGKLSGQVQLSENLALGAYIGYEWEKTRLIPVGSYLSVSDVLGPGGERLSLGPLGIAQREPDQEPRSRGQGGVQLRWRSTEIDTDFGLYAIRYNPTGPANILLTLAGAPFPPPGSLAGRSFRWLYHQGTSAYGASFAKSFNEWSLAGEASIRQNTPLASSPQNVIPAIGVGVGLNNTDNPGYAVGRTAHLQVSWIAALGPSFVSNEASFLGEIAWNTRLKVTKNENMLNPNADRSATGMRTVYSPTYRQAFPGVDLSPSIGIGYTSGRSSAVGPGFGVDKGGDMSLGLTAVYLTTWSASVNYVHYYGPEGPNLNNAGNPQFKQALKDRDFVSISLRTTF